MKVFSLTKPLGQPLVPCPVWLTYLRYNSTSQTSENMRNGPRSTENEWQLQEAKARFSEVFTLARSRGPQRVTRHGKEAVVILTAEEFERLMGRSRQPGSLVEFLSASP